MKQAMPRLLKRCRTIVPPGYRIQIGGEYDKTKTGFKNLAAVMMVSVAAIFLALVFQFKNAIKPLLVLAAAPYGMVGAFIALWIMNEPFGFMAFLGVASLVGVIVSHSIVLFDFIEERRIAGDDFELALIDAGILRLRPVLITVFATVLALLPLGSAWRTSLEVSLLRTNRRTSRCHRRHQTAGASHVRHLCSGFEDPQVGNKRAEGC